MLWRFRFDMPRSWRVWAFAGGIAHDFNNLLMSALGNLELALQNLSMNGGNNVGGLIERRGRPPQSRGSHRATSGLFGENGPHHGESQPLLSRGRAGASVGTLGFEEVLSPL